MIGPDEVKGEAERLAEQNYKFRTFLRNREDEGKLDALFLRFHKEVFAEYDCCKCANCCKECVITLDTGEIERMAAFLGMTKDCVIAEYLTKADPNDEKPYMIKKRPCPFLRTDGKCRVHDCKPDICAGFPYTDRPGRLRRLLGIIDNTGTCPAVFEIIERLKAEYGFRNRE